MLLLTTGPTSVQAMWNFVSDKLLEAVGIEPDPDILAVMMDSLCKVISSVKWLYKMITHIMCVLWDCYVHSKVIG